MTLSTFTSRDGTAIACSRTGAGSPLVLVHGTTADRNRWELVASTLERRFTVYSMDRRGRGGSGDAADYAIEREYEDVAAVVDGIGGPVDVVGHSYGALCALEASLRAANLRRLVLYEPPVPVGMPILPPGIVERLDGLLAAGDREGVVATFLAEVPRIPPTDLAAMRALPAWSARVAAAHTIARELQGSSAYVLEPARFAAMRVPTLLLLGGASPPFFGAAIERIHAALPDARVAVMPGQQHNAIDTAPDRFLREVLGFLG